MAYVIRYAGSLESTLAAVGEPVKITQYADEDAALRALAVLEQVAHGATANVENVGADERAAALAERVVDLDEPADLAAAEERWAAKPPNVAAATEMGRCREVVVPARAEHDGVLARRVTLRWICPRCGGPRGEPRQTFSYDGSRRLAVDGWENPCGHIDKYHALRAEADASSTPPETTTTEMGRA